jgi:hypothetical protein
MINQMEALKVYNDSHAETQYQETPIDSSILIVETANQMEAQYQEKPPIDSSILIVETAGELGNYLQLLPFGIAFQHWLEDEYRVMKPPTLAVHQRIGNFQKSQPTISKLHRCFPRLRDIRFLEPSPTLMDTIQNGPIAESGILFVNGTGNVAPELLEVQYPFDLNRAAIENALNSRAQRDSQLVFYLPLDQNPRDFKSFPEIEEISQSHFHLDYESCGCSGPNMAAVEPHETLLHVRGFQTELANWEEMRLYDLDPERVAHSLLGHLQPKVDSVVVMGRFFSSLNSYVDALQARGIATRKIVNQTDMQDFCLLSKSRKVAGQMRSTFFYHALLLNHNLERADAYEIIDNQRSLRYRPCRNLGNNETIHCHVFKPQK